MDCLLACGGTMEMVFNYGGVRFLGCALQFFLIFVVLSWNVDVGGLVGTMLQRLRINGTTFGELSIIWFIVFGFGFSM
jgi:hypothetical protein